MARSPISSSRLPRPVILLATTNQAKRRELLGLLGDLPVDWVTLLDLKGAPHVEETGSSFVENALLKARAYAAWSGIPALADDGGLVIDALGGDPGVRSRRWIDGRDASDEALIAYACERMEGVPPRERGASMRVAEALVIPPASAGTLPPGPSEVVGEGAMTGELALEPSQRRDPGFPYRSILFLPSIGKFAVDLSDDEHRAVSHRRVALAPIRARLLESGGEPARPHGLDGPDRMGAT